MSVIKHNNVEYATTTTTILDYLNSAIQMKPLLKHVDVNTISKAAESGLVENMTIDDTFKYLAETTASFSYKGYNYSLLAGRLEMIRLWKSTSDSFTQAMLSVQDLLQPEFVKKLQEYNYDQHIRSINDYSYDIIGVRTLMRSYLLKNKQGKIVERPQYMLMRVAVFLNDDIKSVLKTYEGLTEKYYIHASPTLFNSGMINSQLASCFLLPVDEDSLTGIFSTLNKTAQISKMAGGIGFSVSNVRSRGSAIKSINGKSDGLVPMLKVFNHTSRYVNQGGRRKGAFAAYLEMHHDDVYDFLQLKLNHGDEEARARDLFYALFICDKFMSAVENDEDWFLFSPSDVPDLQDKYGADYTESYNKHVEEGKYRRKVKARHLWSQICKSQIETGTPYILFKNACNSKSNQQNLGTIRSSNLCAEIVEYSSKDEIAVCTLASICLPRFMTQNGMNFNKLQKCAYLACKNLNKVIDKTTYPLPEAARSNENHRPIGIGCQGLSDVFQMLNIAYDSEEALELNEKIFETIYYGAMKCSIDLAEKNGCYSSFPGSPLSQGMFQFDLWGVEPKYYDWSQLRQRLLRYGAVNSLLIALMPTASSAQINSNTESFEPITSNIYVRRILSGEFMIINRHLENVLRKHQLWTDNIIQQIIKYKGSIQNIEEIPNEIKSVYKTVWELSNKALIDLSVNRAPYVCQSQSLNLYLSQPNESSITSMHFYSWKKGLKTACYYLRTHAKASAVAFTCESCSA